MANEDNNETLIPIRPRKPIPIKPRKPIPIKPKD